jgi:NADPH:quinone reductase-like Zn-dependent oxidoreductase
VSERVFESQIAAQRPALLADHKIQGAVVMPGAAYLEMALAASAAVFGQPCCVCGMSLREPLLLDKAAKTVQTILSPEGPQTAQFRVVSLKETDDGEPVFVTHAAGRVEAPAAPGDPVDMEAQRARFTGEPRDDAWRVEALRKSGLEPGPTFSWTPLHWVQQHDALAEVREPQPADRAEEYFAHPGLLDAAFQLLGAALPGAGTGIDAYVPMSVDRLQWFDRPQGPSRYLVSLTSLEGNSAVGDARLVDLTGRVLMKLEGVRLRRVPRDWLARLIAGPLPDWCYTLNWVPQPVAPSAEPAPPEAGRWLIFDSRDGAGAALAQRLQQEGRPSTLVPCDVDPAARAAAVVTAGADAESKLRGIVYLTGLDADGTPDALDFAAARDCGWGGLLDVVHAMAQLKGADVPRLWVATRGAQAAGERPLPLALAQSPVWGLGRVIAAEFPGMLSTRIDLDPEDRPAAVQRLAEEIAWNQREDQVAYRGGQRLVARLQRLRHAGAEGLEVPRGQPYRLEITSRGQLDNVLLRPVVRQQPRPGQIEIRVRATGLNFRDVLNVLDLYPGDPGPLGGECAGEVVTVGEGVQGFKPGDSVVAMAPASFASHVVTLAEFAAAKPEHLSCAEAATIPICFATVELALRRLGRMQPGERVLIHAASGGVGLAAVQIARRLGLQIFATAGSPRKREYLKTLGIEHVFDSRSTDFAAQIMEATAGQGIDLVLNSLTGETIAASLSVLRAGGRFMELGKTDLWDQARVDEFRPGVTFYPIALDRMMAEEPAAVGRLIRDVMAQVAEKTLTPLPLRTFRIQQTVQALRLMARAEHIGKVVIQAAPAAEAAERGLALRGDASYLVTGGLGGLGLKLARWLVDRGARCLILVGRSAPSEEACRQIAELQQGGARVVVRSCDVGDRAAVADLLSGIAAGLPPLRGIFHLAGILDDGVLREQTRERFDRVMAPKACGAWYLHELTGDVPLDLFVLFSSAAALLGSPGQGNYAAANAVLDALAHHRRWQKRPALSVNWGSWADVGMAAKLKQSEGRRWSAAGVGWIDPAKGLQTLEQLIAEDYAQAGVLPIDWPKFFERIPTGSEPAWLADVAREARSAAPAAAHSGPPVLLEQLQAVTPGERLALAVTQLRQQAARVLAMSDAELPDPRRPLNELGFDSLTGVEFCNGVGRSIGQHLNPTLLFDYPTLEGLAGHVVRTILQLECQGESADGKPAEPPPEVREQVLADVEVMSEDEMDALVRRQLETLQP